MALPVSLEPQEVGPIVTTRILTVSQTGTDNGGILAQIGGSVLDAEGEPVPGAWVALETRAGERLLTVTADTIGRFDLDPVAAGFYQLRARAVGLGERVTEIVVPPHRVNTKPGSPEPLRTAPSSRARAHFL